MALEQELPGINQNDLFLNAFDWEPKTALEQGISALVEPICFLRKCFL